VTKTTPATSEQPYVLSSHLISSHLISPHLTSSHLISSNLISPQLILSPLILSHVISPELFSSTQLISSHLSLFRHRWCCVGIFAVWKWTVENALHTSSLHAAAIVRADLV
jgi:hypothetical protein